jgi:hypothetical protein
VRESIEPNVSQVWTTASVLVSGSAWSRSRAALAAMYRITDHYPAMMDALPVTFGDDLHR